MSDHVTRPEFDRAMVDIRELSKAQRDVLCAKVDGVRNEVQDVAAAAVEIRQDVKAMNVNMGQLRAVVARMDAAREAEAAANRRWTKTVRRWLFPIVVALLLFALGGLGGVAATNGDGDGAENRRLVREVAREVAIEVLKSP